MTNSRTLYGNKMSTDAKVFFDLLWETYSTTLMGGLRQALSNQMDAEMPPAPAYDDDIHQRRANMVQWCDNVLLAKGVEQSDDLESLII